MSHKKPNAPKSILVSKSEYMPDPLWQGFYEGKSSIVSDRLLLYHK